ncbi:ABC transporter ATP-binding protein [Noviherbaspirillum denitrificans]|uniref:ABC transporter ATP-binding protein n=1 Tax=Noviherbaspirillum denitrificans TaxID=1968433 RepID=A0A254TA51_9BURK|nr:ABC transporter ATP-binding protein [Noviherbaspirillum denitrificans]OWW19521.1 ABC transporter ATP-binding protein [Noviherbaspirillum denitrificans]
MSGEIIIRTEAVTRRFGGFTALKNVSVGFEKGKLTSIIGPNGAGKSTFFNILSGAFPPSEGRVVFGDADITGLKPHVYPRIGISKSFQITNIFPAFTVLENVRIALQAHCSRFNFWSPRSRLGLEDKAHSLLQMVGLERHAARLAKELAHGQQRALEIAVALAGDPKLLLMDEPTAGMSPEETSAMMDLIVRLVADRTVILVEHKMKMVMGISDRLVVLHHGEFLAAGTPDEIRNNDEVKRVYLGQH